MKIFDIIEQLKDVDESYQLLCILPEIDLKSRIYVVGQLKENIPGIQLAEREPYLREKTLGTFIGELDTFEESFQNNDFLIGFDYQLNKDQYESRYYQLTDIEIIDEQVIFYSNTGELVELREI